jgi:UDP-glucose 4-epimerase
MYRVQHYPEANLLGTANHLDILANEEHSIEKIVLSSSVTVSGGEMQLPGARHGARDGGDRSSNPV